MLNVFRRGATSKILLGFLGLALFAMVVTGFGTGGGGIGDLAGGGGTGGALVKVGDERITETELAEQVNRQLAQARERQPELDITTFFRGGAFEEILRQMVALKAMVGFGEDQGIGASKRMVDGEIASIPAFRNLAGQFDPQVFQQALRQEGVTEQQLREDIAASLIQRQMLLPVAGNSKVPLGMAQQYATLLLEQRTGAVGIVPAEAMPAGAAPTQAEINAFYRQQQPRYIIPERRVLRYATIGDEQVAAAAAPTDAEIEAYYRQNQARYGAQEGRRLSQVVLPDQAAARAFAAKLAGGTSFAEAARQAGFSAADTSLGRQTKAEFSSVSAAVANAAFAAAEGSTTQPIQSPLGWHIVRVDGIDATPAQPLASVRPEIERALRLQKSEQALGDLVAKVEDALGEGSSFEEVARANGLTIQQSPPVTATGQQPGVQDWQVPTDLSAMLKAGFEMAPDEDPVVEAVTQGRRFAILDVARIVPAAPPALNQIREQVQRDLIAQRANERARQLATQIAAKINAGTSARDAFAGAGVPLPRVETVTARRVDIARPNQPVPPPLAMLFSLPQGRAKILEAPNGSGWFVVHLEQRTPGDARGNPALVQATRAEFARILGEEYAAQFARAVERKLEVERNPEAIAAAKRRLRGGNAAAQ